MPTIESVHRDIALANSYRIELLKTMLALTGALFAFTVTFRPTLAHVDQPWAMWVGWIGLALSMGGGFLQMLGWDHYYKSYRDFDWKLRHAPNGKEIGKNKRENITKWRRICLFFQWAGFALGVIGIGVFSAANISNVRVAPDVPATCAACVGGKATTVTEPKKSASPQNGGAAP